jgi:hypothetical protein
VKVKVTRAFLMDGAVQEVGSVLDVSDKLARELRFIGKAEPVQEMPAQSGPMTTETAAVVVKGKAVKGASNAGQ